MNFIVKHVFAMHTAVILLFIFGIASGVATFIENDFGTETAWAEVYASWWFAGIQIWLGINVTYNIFRFKLFRKEKIPALVFHISFLLILVGAGLTRYFGFEGLLHIREGKMENRILTAEPFVQLQAQKGDKVYSTSIKKLMSQIGGNDFSLTLDVGGDEAIMTYKRLVPNATTKVVEDASGKPMISMMLSEGGQPEEITLSLGDVLEADEAIFVFGDKKPEKVTAKPIIHIYIKEDRFYFTSTGELGWFKMIENTKGNYAPNNEEPFVDKQLYTVGQTNFAPKAIMLKGKEVLVTEQLEEGAKSSGPRLSALVVDITYKGETKEVAMFGMGRNQKGYAKHDTIAGQQFTMEWGSKVVPLPFYIQLIDFQLDRYPGSMSPSSYASEVKVVDKEKNINLPYRVYMNHVLDYRGFRFFQSSYDQDELGTVLSVNQDPGKWPTYIGYLLLGLGLFFNIVNPKSRFRKLAKAINKDMMTQKGKAAALIAALLVGLSSPQSAQATVDPDQYIDYLKKYEITHANKFGTILVQSADGRIKPIDTIAADVFNKVYRKSTFKGITPNQAVLGMMSSPAEWQIQPMIKIFHDELKKIIGIDPSAKYASFNDFFEKEGDHAYKLSKYAEIANRKKPAERNLFDKDVLKVDERLNVCYFVYTGEIFKMIPKVGDPEKMWYSPKTAISKFPKVESDEVRSMLAGYFDTISKGLETGNWSEADKAVERIKAYQTQYAADIMPSQSRINTEIAFNHYKIFQKLTPVYLLAGFALLIFIFIKMMAPGMNLKWISRIVFGVNVLAFAAHTFGLGLRWYIAQHAPWSDSYESMIYIAWALSLSGIVFSRQSPISLSLTSILAGITLFVAHLSWMDPQITTLVPVLKSYWLTIHVSVITASYGFLGLCALLGFFTLILIILRNPNKNDRRSQEIDRNITEATRINEMSMILGLSLLTLGNFLGGVWANESWGRYWGWDAKETWALVSILIYAVVVHFRFVPKLNNQYAFAVASTFSYWAIIMTYFGVNFYLSGMHSYAAGDPVPIPTFVPVIALVMALVSIGAYFRRKVAKSL